MTKTVLRLGFAGTPELAAIVLSTLIEQSKYQFDIIFTQPDRPAGRGQKISYSPVKQLALQHELQIAQPANSLEIGQYRGFSRLDALVVVAYGMILPPVILDQPGFGCINIHTSLLPRWRGAAPIQRAIQSGDKETGVSVIQMDKGLDTGPILGQKKCSIADNETSGSLHDKLAISGAECLMDVLDKIHTGDIHPQLQDSTHATYAKKISKGEARINWALPASELERTIRAFNPAPVAHTELNGIPFRIWEAVVIDQIVSSAPGTILDYSEHGLNIATGDKILRLLKIQPAGKRVMTVKEFYIGKPDIFTPLKPA